MVTYASEDKVSGFKQVLTGKKILCSRKIDEIRAYDNDR